MGGKFGVENLKNLSGILADVLNVASRVIHGNIFGALGLIGSLVALRGVDFSVLGNELGELDAEEQEVIRQAFVARLDLVNKDVQAKISEGIGYVQETAALVAELVESGTKAVELFNKFKKLVGA